MGISPLHTTRQNSPVESARCALLSLVYTESGLFVCMSTICAVSPDPRCIPCLADLLFRANSDARNEQSAIHTKSTDKRPFPVIKQRALLLPLIQCGEQICSACRFGATNQAINSLLAPVPSRGCSCAPGCAELPLITRECANQTLHSHSTCSNTNTSSSHCCGVIRR